MRKFLIIIPFLLINLSFGQKMESSNIWHRLKSDVGDAAKGSVHTFSRPFYWQGDDWLKFGSLMAGTFAITLFETEIRDLFLRNQGKTRDFFARIGEYYGEPLSIVLVTGGIYVFGNIFDNSWARETAVIMTSAILPAGIIQTTAKISAGRARPYTGLGNSYFEPFRMDEDYYSFVSGHTLVAMGISTALAKQINNSVVKGVLYSLGILGGLSRIYTDEHWFSDVVLGGALAMASVNSANSWYKNRKKTGLSGMVWNIIPAKNGLNLIFTW
jgi:membrane-associated phospholipid phosphatase